jgi:hypothetical protein
MKRMNRRLDNEPVLKVQSEFHKKLQPIPAAYPIACDIQATPSAAKQSWKTT